MYRGVNIEEKFGKECETKCHGGCEFGCNGKYELLEIQILM